MTVSQSEKGKQFRALHDAPRTFVIPNPWNVGTARILSALGFRALATTSAGLAFSHGRRDGQGLVTRDEMLAHARTIVEATDLPVSADLENGFADEPNAVAETIRMAAAAGLVGGSVEDATGDPSRPIYDQAHAVERVAAAVEAARSLPFPFVLVARAENFLHGRPDLDDTIRRLKAFAAAGADVLYAPGLSKREQITAVTQAVAPKPVNVLANPALGAITATELGALGAKRISIGGLLARAAYSAALSAAREMASRGTFGFAAEVVPFAE